MKKLFLGILVISLLFGGSAFSEVIELRNCTFTNLKVKKEYNYTINSQKNYVDINGERQVKLIESINNIFTTELYPHLSIPGTSFQAKFYLSNNKVQYLKYESGKLKSSNEYDQICKINSFADEIKRNEIMFTIKDKREQCEAIGFTPETEKFADCVLRLVELDVKQQQDQKIAAAQNSGNIEIANQLLQMRNDNNAQYLINLGQELLKPQQFNSNIYLPQTQRCVLQGFDSFAKMTCR